MWLHKISFLIYSLTTLTSDTSQTRSCSSQKSLPFKIMLAVYCCIHYSVYQNDFYFRHRINCLVYTLTAPTLRHFFLAPLHMVVNTYIQLNWSVVNLRLFTLHLCSCLHEVHVTADSGLPDFNMTGHPPFKCSSPNLCLRLTSPQQSPDRFFFAVLCT